jgi:peptidoglycan-N-acetylglucosamine deacetylase
VQATFFVLGQRVSEPERADLAKRARAMGHWIGNHTFTHSKPLGLLDRDSALREFDQTEAALDWLDQPRRLFRPYGGAGSIGPHLLQPAVVDRLTAGGFTCVLWNSVPGDWRDPHGWVERALADCASRDWSLVVLHDQPSGAMDHLDEFLTRLQDAGFEFAQEFPPDCMPIVDGRIVQPMDGYVASSAPGGATSPGKSGRS